MHVPADIASAADRYLNARKDLKGKATTTDQQTDQPTSPAQSNLPPKTPQHNQAPGRQSAPHNHNNRPNHQSRYNQASTLSLTHVMARVTEDPLHIGSSRPHGPYQWWRQSLNPL
ncbi:hypothetical protein Bpfe_010478 [Biomphalaria pfeifferi]|uniref:Uncharacterized protein n=1 Tax=Biomphalaria pfeifferi TaxID=112525 RepID=A0AAD8BSL8_BIOPF|nr:hypothetical protein Bpfe_010478 [Biomphalaria pfeifferi]